MFDRTIIFYRRGDSIADHATCNDTLLSLTVDLLIN